MTVSTEQRSARNLPLFLTFLSLIIVAFVLFGSHSLTRQATSSSLGYFPQPFNLTTTSTTTARTESFQQAFQESFGFFDDVPQHKWLRRKQIARDRIRVAIPVSEVGRPQLYNHHNWQPEFSCEFEDFIGLGGDGGKWVCDPHRVNRPGCIVYSVGSNGHFDFEVKVQSELYHCEIHIFDFKDYSKQMYEWGVTNASFHAWGLKSTDGTVNDRAMDVKGKRAKGVMKSMPEIVTDLGHVGRWLDIFKIDCEGCEWNSYRDWFQSSGLKGIRQILVETHSVPGPKATEFFDFMRQLGYANFHKEPNIQYGGGSCVEYSFLLLNKTFWTE